MTAAPAAARRRSAEKTGFDGPRTSTFAGSAGSDGRPGVALSTWVRGVVRAAGLPCGSGVGGLGAGGAYDQSFLAPAGGGAAPPRGGDHTAPPPPPERE